MTMPVVQSPRGIPFSLKDKVKEELDRMEGPEVITKVERLTKLVNSMVVVEKGSKVRVCLDPRSSIWLY